MKFWGRSKTSASGLTCFGPTRQPTLPSEQTGLDSQIRMSAFSWMG